MVSRTNACVVLYADRMKGLAYSDWMLTGCRRSLSKLIDWSEADVTSCASRERHQTNGAWLNVFNESAGK
jgi:hypothetical protein